ncbi:MAG: EAL domain-containing protein [Ilumatobacter sp.]|uniref:EAL domain-containing protein n=1 Tax=Ilumatobacter sp. TaxID=1967498 RepID=UPI00391B7B1F
MRVLIIEDDAAVQRVVFDGLKSRSVTTVVAADTVAAGRAALGRQDFHVVIVGLALVDGSGLEIIAELRASGSTAHVIVLTDAAAETDRVHAFESGADDYVIKPFFVRELVARVLAVERRHGLTADTKLHIGPLEINLNARDVTLHHRPLELTAMEFALLAFLAARPGHTFSRGELLEAVGHTSADWHSGSTVTEHVRRLRSKIETDPRQPQLLTTVRGAGYRLDAPESDPSVHRPPPVGTGTLVHVDGYIVSADTTAAQILGHTEPSGLLGRNTLDFAASASRNAVAERRDLIRAGHTRRSQIATAQRSDGSEVIVEMWSSETTWNGQPARRLELMVSDDSPTRLRHLAIGVYSEVSDAVIVTDLHFHVRSWNWAAERLYGWTENDVLGRHLLDVVDFDGDEFSTAERQLEISGRWHTQGRQRTREGSRIDVMSSMTTMLDDHAEAIGIAIVNRVVAMSSDQTDGPPEPDAGDVRRGLDRREFEVHYQPVVALADEHLVTVEALVRWRHPVRGLLSPAAFIDVAERNGLIIELDAFVLDTASRQVAAWRAEGADIGLSVNVSAAALADAGLVDRVIATLETAGLDAHALWLEVTETSLVRNVDQAAAMLHRLADQGIGIAIDDFGTGWASLTYLSKFPIHALKIDRSFVAGIGENPNDRAIVRSIVHLGAELGLAVVAEGIETAAQSEAVQAIGCAIGQGYLFGKPTPPDEVAVHLAHRVRPLELTMAANWGSSDAHAAPSAIGSSRTS